MAMWNPTLSIDGKEVLASGTVVIKHREQFVITVSPTYKLKFRFIQEVNSPGKINWKNNDGIEIDLINMEGLIQSNTESIYIANQDGKKVYFNIIVLGSGTGADNQGKLALAYTFFLGD